MADDSDGHKGTQVEPEAMTGVYKNMARGIIALVFRARVAGGAPAATTDETVRLDWVTPERVSALCDEAYAIRILDALRPGHAAVRAHDGFALPNEFAAPADAGREVASRPGAGGVASRGSAAP